MRSKFNKIDLLVDNKYKNRLNVNGISGYKNYFWVKVFTRIWCFKNCSWVFSVLIIAKEKKYLNFSYLAWKSNSKIVLDLLCSGSVEVRVKAIWKTRETINLQVLSFAVVVEVELFTRIAKVLSTSLSNPSGLFSGFVM